MASIHPNWARYLADKSHTALMILIFSNFHRLNHLFKLEIAETHALAFLSHIVLATAGM